MKNLIILSLGLLLLVGFSKCSTKGTYSGNVNEIDSLRNRIKELVAGNEAVAANLAMFDSLDFTVFNKQNWASLHQSHSNRIKVYWPDGHITDGLDRHMNDLKAMFLYAPDTKITQHPIRFGSENFTCVTGVMSGTFSSPMYISETKSIKPTGKSFSLPICTIGIWDKGVMVEEYLFWDNREFMNQIGITN